MTKRVVVQVRCSEGEKAVWAAKAAVIGVSLSEWVRGQLNRVGEVGPQPPVASYSERFVVPASCPAPNTKKSFKPDFK